MKKIILLICITILTTTLIKAQDFQFTPFAGYTFADKFKIDRGNARIGGGFTYGGILSYVIHESIAIELTYSRQDCDASAYSDYYEIDVWGPISANYIYLGGSKLLQLNEDMFLFTGTNVGMGIYSGKDNSTSSTTKFAVGLNGGLKYFFSDKVGLRLQANLNFPITDIGGGLWWGIGSGPSVGLTSRIPFLQFGFSGGLVFTLN
jgi:hypothetical protein